MKRSTDVVQGARKFERKEYQMIYIVAFPFFLFAALLMRCLPSRLQSGSAAKSGYHSLITQANELASASIPYAFMG